MIPANISTINPDGPLAGEADNFDGIPADGICSNERELAFHCGGGSGFTLVELLVVVAIIAVLTAIAVPVVSHLQTHGKQAKCISNMRQIGVALMLYANENNGDLPQTTHTAGIHFERAWIFQLKPYLSDCDKVRICPADPKSKERLENNGTSYILNSYVFVPTIGPFGEKREAFNNIRRILYPAATFLAFNISDEQSPTVMSDHTHSERWRGN